MLPYTQRAVCLWSRFFSLYRSFSPVVGQRRGRFQPVVHNYFRLTAHFSLCALRHRYQLLPVPLLLLLLLLLDPLLILLLLLLLSRFNSPIPFLHSYDATSRLLLSHLLVPRIPFVIDMWPHSPFAAFVFLIAIPVLSNLLFFSPHINIYTTATCIYIIIRVCVYKEKSKSPRSRTNSFSPF